MLRHCGRRLALPLILLAGIAALAGAGATAANAAPFPNCLTNCAGVDIVLDFPAYNACTGEFVLITGVYHVLMTTTTTGDTVTSKVYTNYQNSSGVALVTGTRYQANLTDRQYEQTDPLSGEMDVRFDDDYELVSLSPTPNMIIHAVFHAHLDALGIPTAVKIDKLDAYCAGQGGKTPLP